MSTQIKRLMVVLVALFMTAAVTGCGPKAVPSTSVMDTPEYHYNEGLKLMDADRLDDAMREFDRAIALDPKSSLDMLMIIQEMLNL